MKRVSIINSCPRSQLYFYLIIFYILCLQVFRNSKRITAIRETGVSWGPNFMESQLRDILKSPVHHSTIVLRGLRRKCKISLVCLQQCVSEVEGCSVGVWRISHVFLRGCIGTISIKTIVHSKKYFCVLHRIRFSYQVDLSHRARFLFKLIKRKIYLEFRNIINQKLLKL